MKITFFLEYQKKDGDRYTLYGDFATLKDARDFYQHLNQSPIEDDLEVPTGFRIDGIKPGKRLFEESYYFLETNGARISRNEDSSLEAYVIDYSNYPFDQRTVVVEAAKEFTPLEAKSNMSKSALTKILDSFPTANENEKEFVRVNDVGQGNLNEYHIGEQIPLVYDLGTNMNSSEDDVRALVDKILCEYKPLENKPVLVISHWDKDHYHCLLQLRPKELDLFECFVIMKTIPTASAEKAYNRIASNPSAKILAVPQISSSSKGTGISSLFYSGNKVSIYQGIGKKMNISGLIVCVSNNEFLSVLPGDCAWFQINHILREEAITKNARCCNLVVPHHGSGKDQSFKGFVVPPSWTYGIPAISVGKNNHNHPNSSVEDYIMSLFDKRVKRTDKHGPIRLNM